MAWIKKGNKNIAILDIMGFKSSIVDLGIDAVYENMLIISALKNSINNNPIEELDPDSQIKLRSQIYSDTIIVITNTDSVEHAMNLEIYVNHIVGTCMSKNIPIKGATASGEIIYDESNNILIGQPIIDAISLQDKMKCYGVVMHHSLERKYREEYSSKMTLYGTFETKIPFEKGLITHRYYDWIYSVIFNNELAQSPAGREYFINSLLSQFLSKVSGEPRKYIESTREIVDSWFKNNPLPK